MPGMTSRPKEEKVEQKKGRTDELRWSKKPNLGASDVSPRVDDDARPPGDSSERSRRLEELLSKQVFIAAKKKGGISAFLPPHISETDPTSPPRTPPRPSLSHNLASVELYVEEALHRSLCLVLIPLSADQLRFFSLLPLLLPSLGKLQQEPELLVESSSFASVHLPLQPTLLIPSSCLNPPSPLPLHPVDQNPNQIPISQVNPVSSHVQNLLRRRLSRCLTSRSKCSLNRRS